MVIRQRMHRVLAFLLIGFFAVSCSLFDNDRKASVPFPCEDGMADGYPCENVDMFAHLSLYELTGDSVDTRLNDIWGWTDPQTQKEYALVGYTTGVSFVDISDPAQPLVVGRLPESNLRAKYKRLSFDQYPSCNLSIGNTEFSRSLTEGSTWRDVKVYDNHAFVVSDAQPHGMQVFDLTKLRNYSGEVMTLEQDALYDRFGSAHNIVINEATGYAYGVGITQGEICGSRDSTGLHMVNIQNPKNPEFAGCYIDGSPGNYRIAKGYIHDAQCVIYDGPDTEYSGKEICFNSSEGNVVIADVSDKANPQTLGYKRQVDMQYSHQGWLTEDHSFFLMNDELDERNLGRETKTYVWDVRDLEDPKFIGYYSHETPSIDHNLYVKGQYAYETNYNAGLQILDLSGVADAQLERIAYFDTQPQTDAPNFTGTWSNYPFYESGLVVLSDIETGLFVVRPNLD
ncbi:choice-of-anchor B family protein [Gracilimonas mengyeensis]|uniref:Choice-of-anchor B domain-containing protein n=1 Tax=Gracilimonas mengyeensis TaxID=1302730 RepID=A0A521DNM6_9BACT|nr:choice-of-anchor B family protein [Gracilimonas mengyeensis]SMO72671.1 choice-of-anchor B domain-containing protein [Gracilimonas mengyeensis]